MLGPDLESVFRQIGDAGIRNRMLGEFGAIRRRTRNRVNWDRSRILDFGCGQGIAAASIAARFPTSEIHGADILDFDKDYIQSVMKTHVDIDLPRNLFFHRIGSDSFEKEQGFNLIYAWSVFEHVPVAAIPGVLRDLKRRLTPGGILFLQVDPLYFSPRGSHLYSFFKEPWHHLIYNIDEIRQGVMAGGTSSSKERILQQFMELNRLTGPQIISYASECGLSLDEKQFFQTEIEPPPSLLEVYTKEALTTVGFEALFHKG